MDDVTQSIEAARRRAVPIPWTPPLPVVALGADHVHPHLVAEVAVRQLRPIQRALDGVGLRELAFDVQHLANRLESAVRTPLRVA